MKQKITAFHLDEEDDWVADLECGHRQHMRHNPPWMNRPWILSVEGRQNHYGTELECKRCSELGSTIAEAIRSACLSAAREASEDAGIRGLCKEGQLELALDTIQALRLESVIEEATRRFVIASKAVSWPD